MVIYKITCLENNKIYIGQSKNTAERRFKHHIKAAISGELNTHLARAIRKYGSEAFKLEVIDRADSQEELTEKEYYYINLYNACDPTVGYNETDDSNKCGGNTYKYKSKEEMEEIKAKISKAMLGENNGMSKAVKCLNIETKEILRFGSIFECGRFFNKSYTGFIRKRCEEYADPYLGKWMFAWENDEFKDPKVFDPSTKNGIKIKLTNVKDNSSIILNSKNKAAKFLNISAVCIINNAIINNYQINIL